MIPNAWIITGIIIFIIGEIIIMSQEVDGFREFLFCNIFNLTITIILVGMAYIGNEVITIFGFMNVLKVLGVVGLIALVKVGLFLLNKKLHRGYVEK